MSAEMPSSTEIETEQSEETRPPKQPAKEKRIHYFANEGELLRAENINNVEMTSRSDGTASSSPSMPIPKDVTDFYANRGDVVVAKTITGTLKMDHTSGKRREN